MGAKAPVEVLALDLDVGHAIANLALARLARSLLFAGTHSDGEDSGVRWYEKVAGRELRTSHAKTKQERGRRGLFLCAATSHSAMCTAGLLRRLRRFDWLPLFF
jgi:hypothetical protein